MSNSHTKKSKPTPFRKYDVMGAYHWNECDRSSSCYNPPLEARYQIVLRRVEKSDRVLDIGCGDGYLMGLLHPLFQQTVGVDSEFKAVKLAQEKLRPFAHCHVTKGNCYELPFREKYFDLVLLSDVIEHLDCPEECLSEIRRVLTPSGTLLITTPRWRGDRMWDVCHVREFKPEELRHLLKPFFSQVTLSFFWPLPWSKMYATRYGWHLIRLFSRYFYNPFLKEEASPGKFGQILAICRGPE